MPSPATTSIPNAWITRFGGRDVLVSMPNGRQYGHLALEVTLAFAEARRRTLPVYFIQSPVITNRAVFDVQPENVEVLPPSVVRRWVLEPRTQLAANWLRWKKANWFRWKKAVKKDVRLLSKDFSRDFREEVRRQLAKQWLPLQVRQDLKGLERSVQRRVGVFAERVADDEEERPYYYHRQLLRHPIRVTLPDDRLEDARGRAARAGLDLSAPIVTVHMREAGYKLGAELQDTKPWIARDESVRNVRLESYLDTMDLLVRRGFLVVRIGDPSMAPLRRPGVFDLATSPARSELLELLCIAQSRFLLGCDSGPSYVSYLTDTALVCVNCTAPIATYPIRRRGVYLLKPMTERASGRRLRLRDMLLAECGATFRDTCVYRYDDNTSEEILEAVTEMLELLEADRELSPVQTAYRDAVFEADRLYRGSADYVRKWGADDGFIGDGRLAHGFAERYW